MEGQIAKGMAAGCIACYKGGGNNIVFTTDHLTTWPSGPA